MEGAGESGAHLIDLNRLESRSLFESSTGSTLVERLSGWGEGIEVRRVQDLIYLPEYGVPIANGFCPEELIAYSFHLDLRLEHDSSDGTTAPRPLLDPSHFDRRDYEVLILGNPFSHVFGHWIEELLKVVVLESINFSGYYVVPSWYSAHYVESLMMLGVSPERLLQIETPTVFSGALVTTNINLRTIHRFRGVAGRLREQMVGALGGLSGQVERVWAIRGSSANGRRLINEEEVHDSAKRHGFEFVDYAAFSFREQIALDRGARVLAGPHGSAMLHSAFLRDHSDIIELLSPLYVNPSIPFCRIFNHRYNQVVGLNRPQVPYEYGQDIFVHIEHLETVLNSLI